MTSNWSGNYTVGDTNFASVLLIQNSGMLLNGAVILGNTTGSSNNSVSITGLGSVCNNGAVDLHVGQNGPGNRLVISNGGLVVVGRNSFNGSYVGSNLSSSNNSVLVTDSGSVWSNSGTLSFGYASPGNSLVVSNGGRLVDSAGYIYSGSGVTSNNVSVTGPGSVWNNTGTLVVGQGKGSGNSLVISDGGLVISTHGILLSPSNSVLVSGAGSVWSNRNDLYLGSVGSGNTLVISNGGQMVNSIGYIGYGSGSSGSSNSVRVVNGGVWQNSVLYVGYQSSSNSLVIVGGSVDATNPVVGAASPTCDNVVELDSGSLIVTNNGTGVLGGAPWRIDRQWRCAAGRHTGNDEWLRVLGSHWRYADRGQRGSRPKYVSHRIRHAARQRHPCHLDDGTGRNQRVAGYSPGEPTAAIPRMALPTSSS